VTALILRAAPQRSPPYRQSLTVLTARTAPRAHPDGMNQLQRWLGGILNTLGIPGFVSDTTYRSARFDAHVRVSRGKSYTVICVNGLDLYFRRLSGRIDGVGFSRTPDCMPVPVRESGSVAATDVDREPR